jgi:hypothetical protein
MEKIMPPKRYSVQQHPATIVHEAYKRRYE